MKKKSMLKEKKKYKRNQRRLKKITRDVTSKLKFLRIYNVTQMPYFLERIGFDIRELYNIYDFIYWKSGHQNYDIPTTIKFDMPREYKRRYPNEKEIINERISILRSLYISGKMCRNAYYTLKGLARKDPANAENFIRKHDELGYEYLQLFKTTESILDMFVLWKPDTITSKIYTIDLNLKEEN